MERVFEGHNSPMLLIDPSLGLIIDANQAALRFYGYSKEQISQIPVNQINTLTGDEINEEMRRATTEVRNYFYFRHRLASGEVRDVEVHSSPVKVDGRTLLFSIIYDITERTRIEAALARSEAISATMLQAIPLPVFYKDMEKRYLGCNDAFARLAGLSKEQIIGRTVYELKQSKQPAFFQSAPVFDEYDKKLFDTPERVQIYEVQVNNEQGEQRDILFHKAAIFDRDNNKVGLVGVILDITERKRMEEHNRQLAHYDILTGLANRHLIANRLNQAQSNSQQSNLYSGLLFLDLDNFKPLNDQHGHDVGDQLLVEVARRIKHSVRANDTVGRLAGDEFVVILEALGKDLAHARIQLQHLAEKIRQTLAEAYELDRIKHSCTASIGAVIFHGHEISGPDLLKQADHAMYQAKNSGRNRVWMYPALNQANSQTN